MNKILVTIPHSGEKVPDLTPWLKNLSEEVLMCDVDRYVDRLYTPNLEKLQIPYIKTEWHRYAADLNRIPEDVDASSVIGNTTPAGTHNRGFHWVVTTHNQNLLPQPMPEDTHRALTQLIYEPFHQQVRDLVARLRNQGAQNIFHIDAHSMPSLGTAMHRDPGQRRADIVISDCSGQSCLPEFRDLVIAAYAVAGFRVGYNWPYMGGRVTEQYGHPEKNHQSIQVELNRDLYMDEKTKKLKPQSAEVQNKLLVALSYVTNKIQNS